MVCGIYQLENTITSQVYIGRSVNVAKRIYTHFWKLRNRRHNNDHLQASFDKYGEASFIAHTLIICRIEDLPLYEKLAIKAFDAGNRDVGFNQMTVGENGHYVHTAEAKQKSTDSNLERWKDPEYRARMSVHYKRTAAKLWADPEFREIRSKAATEQWKDPARREQFRAKRSVSAKAMWQDPEYRAKRDKSSRKSWQNPERKAQVRESLKRQWQDPEYRANVMAGRARARAAKAAGEDNAE